MGQTQTTMQKTLVLQSFHWIKLLEMCECFMNVSALVGPCLCICVSACVCLDAQTAMYNAYTTYLLMTKLFIWWRRTWDARGSPSFSSTVTSQLVSLDRPVGGLVHIKKSNKDDSYITTSNNDMLYSHWKLDQKQRFARHFSTDMYLIKFFHSLEYGCYRKHSMCSAYWMWWDCDREGSVQ